MAVEQALRAAPTAPRARPLTAAAVPVVAAGAVLGLGAAALGPALLALLLALGVVAVALPTSLPAVLRGTLALLVSVVLALVLALAAGALGVAWSPWLLSGPVLVAAAGAALAAPAAAVRRARAWRWTLPDLAGGVLAALVVLPVAARLAGLSEPERLGALASAIDNVNHLSIVAGIQQVGGLLALDLPAAAEHVLVGHATYPAGFHLLAATVASAAGVTDVQALAGWFLGATLLAYAALVVVAAAVAARAWDALGGRSGTGRLAALVLVAAAFAVPPLSGLVTDGFVAQTVASAMLLGAVLLAWWPLGDPGSGGVRPLTVAGLLLVLTVGVAHTWWFALPVVGVLVLAWAAHRRAVLALHRQRLLVWCAAAGVLVGAQVALGLWRGNFGAVNLDGQIGEPPWAVATLLLTAVVATTVLARRRTDWTRSPALPGVGAAILLSVAVAAYQLATAGALSYYHTKTLHLVVLLTLPLAAATAAVGVERLRPRRGTDVALVLGAAALLAGVAAGPLAGYAGGRSALPTDALQRGLAAATAEDAGTAGGAPLVLLANGLPASDGTDVRMQNRLLAVLLDQHVDVLAVTLQAPEGGGAPLSPAAVASLAGRTGRPVVVVAGSPAEAAPYASLPDTVADVQVVVR